MGAAATEALRLGGAWVAALSSNDGDLADPAAPDRLWAQSLERLDGRIDVLINNAGIFEASPIVTEADAWLAGWNRTLQVNLTSAAQLCRLAVRHWQDRASGGRIVNIASRAAHRGDGPDYWHYAAAKAGLVALTKTIARAYAREGIYAFAICPGFTVTGDPGAYMESRGGDHLLADIPLGRVNRPEEIGEMMRWCATSAPAAMTGAVLDVNGASYVR